MLINEYPGIKIINKELYYLPSQELPVLSADIGIWFDGNNLWIYDCGANDESYNLLCSLFTSEEFQHINLVISHFHNDHSGNIYKLINNKSICNKLSIYAGNYTLKHIKHGKLIDSHIYFNGIENRFHLFPIPNTHCKGSIALEINDKYVFLGDSIYGKHVDRYLTYNVQLLIEQIKVLEGIKAEICLLSHDNNYVVSKEDVLCKLKKILSFRKSSEALIFF